MDVELAASLPLSSELPQCKGCRSAPVTSYSYTTCASCRLKRAQYKRNRTAKLAAEKLVLTAGIIANLPASFEENVGVGGKRKTRPEGDEDVVVSMRKRFKAMISFEKQSYLKPSPIDPATPVFEKFAVSADLYKEIKRQYSSTTVASLHFYGTYAIISIPDIDNKQRARIVARDLKENTNLRFSLDDKKATNSGDDTHTIRYRCNCHTTSTLKRHASDLSVYFGLKKKTPDASTPEANTTPQRSECSGKIKISVENDDSHPLGWLGQRVKVTVVHPKKM